jgi:hypothetical protein
MGEFRELRVQMLVAGCFACVLRIGMIFWMEFKLWEVAYEASRLLAPWINLAIHR